MTRLSTRLRAYVSVSLPNLSFFPSFYFFPFLLFPHSPLASALEHMEGIVLQTKVSVPHLCLLIGTYISLADVGPESSQQGSCTPCWTPEDPVRALLGFRKQGIEREGGYEKTPSPGHSECTRIFLCCYLGSWPSEHFPNQIVWASVECPPQEGCWQWTCS